MAAPANAFYSQACLTTHFGGGTPYFTIRCTYTYLSSEFLAGVEIDFNCILNKDGSAHPGYPVVGAHTLHSVGHSFAPWSDNISCPSGAYELRAESRLQNGSNFSSWDVDTRYWNGDAGC
jgi:hypothetical protein